MSTKYAQHFSTRATPQSEPIPGKDMVPNSAGGQVFNVGCWKRLERFLILGCEGGTYYASERKLTRGNAQCVLECAGADIDRTVNLILDISVGGRAPKNDPAVFALGLLSGHRESLAALNGVCRTATHLFQFIAAAKGNRGWGRSLKRAVQNWYLSKNAQDVAYQVVKYQSRDGWSHRDVLRLCKPHGSGLHSLVFRWAVGKVTDEDLRELPLIHAFEQAKQAVNAREIARLIRDHGLVRECIPTQFLNDVGVWEALLEKMPATALIRNLGKMTAVGLLKPLSEAVEVVCKRLTDVEWLRRGRVHPMAVLLAESVYVTGHGNKGGLTWSPVAQVIDALDRAFYAAFQAVVPTGKRWLLALDVSGSMDGSFIAGTPICAREATAAMALVTSSVEPRHAIIGFTGSGYGNGRRSLRGGMSGVEPLAISAGQRLDDVSAYMRRLPMGRTDCALPMMYAEHEKIKADVFVIYTDNETWCGEIHPCQALASYRRVMGIPAKLVVVGMTATDFTIADPSDDGMLDVVGFDTAAPSVIADFSR